jgi:hypothetical protein
MPLIATIASASARAFGAFVSSGPFGQNIYTTPGTYSWTCPVGVTSVSVVVIGGGSGYEGLAGANGGGGGLAYKNNITVIPGNSYQVVVGAGGINGANLGQPNGAFGTGSSFNVTSVTAGGGTGGWSVYNGSSYDVTNGVGGSFSGDGGSAGMNGIGSGYDPGSGQAGGAGVYSGSTVTFTGSYLFGGTGNGTAIGSQYGSAGFQTGGGNGQNGAVRIIYPATLRSFPSTRVGNF